MLLITKSKFISQTFAVAVLKMNEEYPHKHLGIAPDVGHVARAGGDDFAVLDEQ
jgi:hypothetical protein